MTTAASRAVPATASAAGTTGRSATAVAGRSADTDRDSSGSSAGCCPCAAVTTGIGPVAGSVCMASAVAWVARSARVAWRRSEVVMRPSGMFGRNRIAISATIASGTPTRNAWEMPVA